MIPCRERLLDTLNRDDLIPRAVRFTCAWLVWEDPFHHHDHFIIGKIYGSQLF